MLPRLAWDSYLQQAERRSMLTSLHRGHKRRLNWHRAIVIRGHVRGPKIFCGISWGFYVWRI